MGQKVHPIGIRLGIVKDWTSKWYADSKDYANNLYTDLKVREFLKKKLAGASVSNIQIERPANNARITIHTARPGIVIGKKGEDIDVLRKAVSKMMNVPVHINIEEIRKPELDAYLVAENIAQQLERALQCLGIARALGPFLGSSPMSVQCLGDLGQVAATPLRHQRLRARWDRGVRGAALEAGETALGQRRAQRFEQPVRPRIVEATRHGGKDGQLMLSPERTQHLAHGRRPRAPVLYIARL